MSCEDRGGYKPRFKGVENFFRRIAFNLGNTPSQTEVKIISCIPIDVSELQQRIVDLEKQVLECKCPKCQASEGAANNPNTPVQVAMGAPCYPNDCSLDTTSAENSKSQWTESGQSSGVNENDLDDSSKQRKSAQSFKCPLDSIEINIHRSSSRNIKSPTESVTGKSKVNFFKRESGKKRKKQHIVYYAHTNSSPFTNSKLTKNLKGQEKFKKNNNDIDHSYFANVVRKQYKPKAFRDELSEFSSPICRDIDQDSDVCRKESEMCSCCHGQFNNIDSHRSRHNFNDHINEQSYKQKYKNNAIYYDSSLYDLVPVKEKPIKLKKEGPILRNKEPEINMCWPESIRAKYPFNNINQSSEVTTDLNYLSKMAASNRKGNSFKKTNKRKLNKENCSNSALEDQYKHEECVTSRKNKTIVVPLKTITCKNAECLTINVNNTECQTTTSQSVQLEPIHNEENKTEVTLNKIKSILQTVLTQVKINTQSKLPTAEEPKKKDVTIQKRDSQNDIQAYSSLLNSYTYSPYNINPYIASCSRHLPTGRVHYSNLPYASAKCTQNFPLFVHTPCRQMCSNCYRHNSQTAKAHPKQATTAATNTETENKKRNTETEKLLKEIYKSMTLNLNLPIKDTSTSEYDDLKSDTNNSIRKYEQSMTPIQDIKCRVLRVVSEVVDKKNIHRDFATTPTNTTPSKMTSAAASVQSQMTSSTERSKRAKSFDIGGKSQSKINELTEKDLYEPHGLTIDEDDRNESSSTESESDTDVFVPKDVKKKKRRGLFSKVFLRLFKSKELKKVKEEAEVEDEEECEESDSDDYQTICSQRTLKPTPIRTPRHTRQGIQIVRTPRRPFSKLVYSKRQMHLRERNLERLRKPYMEQEYRRYWDEKLMFHDNVQRSPRHSSEAPYVSPSTPSKPVYWQNYEARAATVRPNTEIYAVPPRDYTQVTQRYVSPNRHSAHRVATKHFLPTNTVNVGTLDNIEVHKNAIHNYRPIEEKTRRAAAKSIKWLKKNKIGANCKGQWKQLLLEN